MSKSQKGGLWSRLKNIAGSRSESFTVIPGNSRITTHVRYEDGSVSVIPLPPNMQEIPFIR